MNCDVAREALSARIDGEREPVPSARVDEHLAGCPDCRGWNARAQQQAEQLRALAGVHRPVPAALDSADPAAPAVRASRPKSRRWVSIRVALGVIGVVQLVLAAIQATTGDLGLGHGHGGHLLNESTAWSAALGAAMLLAAARPVAAAGVAGVLALFSLLLGGYVIADALTGAVSPARVASHLPVLIATVLAALLWRNEVRPDPPADTETVLAEIVLPDSATTGRRRHLREAG